MALVDYSGSESSDDERTLAPKEPSKPNAVTAKPAFQKVVDSSNSSKIRISLPEPSKSFSQDDETERPSKKAKIGTGGLSGFNALLPAPKRTTVSSGGNPTTDQKRSGMGSGINLKTGAAPGFSRAPESISEDGTDRAEESTSDVANPGVAKHPAQRSPPSTTDSPLSLVSGEQKANVKPPGKPTMFKPLSVARKPQKKKTVDGSAAARAQGSPLGNQVHPTQKVSLFSTGESLERSSDRSSTKGVYQPMVYHNGTSIADEANIVETPDISNEESLNGISAPDLNAAVSQPLEAIASDLNLSASAKRQLFGRQKSSASAVNLINFNTDEEYKANEALRQSGEQVQHNPVRAIQPGKHSLKQLVNMGTMQADALEESFASGRRNRNEAGSKYGW
ncbi:hypothetical protein ACLMJK_004838 [Lecanora helva]